MKISEKLLGWYSVDIDIKIICRSLNGFSVDQIN